MLKHEPFVAVATTTLLDIAHQGFPTEHTKLSLSKWCLEAYNACRTAVADTDTFLGTFSTLGHREQLWQLQQHVRAYIVRYHRTLEEPSSIMRWSLLSVLWTIQCHIDALYGCLVAPEYPDTSDALVHEQMVLSTTPFADASTASLTQVSTLLELVLNRLEHVHTWSPPLTAYVKALMRRVAEYVAGVSRTAPLCYNYAEWSTADGGAHQNLVLATAHAFVWIVCARRVYLFWDAPDSVFLQWEVRTLGTGVSTPTPDECAAVTRHIQDRASASTFQEQMLVFRDVSRPYNVHPALPDMYSAMHQFPGEKVSRVEDVLIHDRNADAAMYAMGNKYKSWTFGDWMAELAASTTDVGGAVSQRLHAAAAALTLVDREFLTAGISEPWSQHYVHMLRHVAVFPQQQLARTRQRRGWPWVLQVGATWVCVRHPFKENPATQQEFARLAEEHAELFMSESVWIVRTSHVLDAFAQWAVWVLDQWNGVLESGENARPLLLQLLGRLAQPIKYDTA